MVNTNVDTDLAAALEALTPEPPRRGPRCTVGVVLDELAPSARAKLEAAMARPGIASSRIAQTLTIHGYQIKAGTVARHRRAGTATGCLCTPAEQASA